MGIPIIGDIIEAVKDLASEVVVDVDKKKEIEVRLQEIGDRAEERLHEELMGQIEINKVEAASGNIFVAGWRPFVGWVGGFGFAYAAILQPFANWVATVGFGYSRPLPEADTALLMTVLMGLLGLGAQRSYEKVKGVSTNDYRDRSR